jgi:hypothetical protein
MDIEKICGKKSERKTNLEYLTECFEKVIRSYGKADIRVYAYMILFTNALNLNNLEEAYRKSIIDLIESAKEVMRWR